MSSLRIIPFAVLLLLLAVQHASAWGLDGHRAVCELAFQHLNDTAKAAVLDLVGKDPGYTTFRESCTWPDTPKKRRIEHWLNVPRHWDHIGTATCVVEQPCIMSAIPGDLDVLKTSDDDDAKIRSLKFLGHWIGDLHQPLHVSFKDDQGANLIKTSGDCGVSMHGAWDDCLLDESIGTGWEALYEAIAEEAITPDLKRAWMESDFVEWADESYATRSPLRPSTALAGRMDAAIPAASSSTQGPRKQSGSTRPIWTT